MLTVTVTVTEEGHLLLLNQTIMPSSNTNNKSSKAPLLLNCSFDAGILSPSPSDNPHSSSSSSSNNNNNHTNHIPPFSDSESEEKSHSTPPLPNLAATFRLLTDSLARLEEAQLGMIKTREASRWEAEKRRLQSEAELTRVMLQTQLLHLTSSYANAPTTGTSTTTTTTTTTTASIVNSSRKRKRVEQQSKDPDADMSSPSQAPTAARQKEGGGGGGGGGGDREALLLSLLQCNLMALY